MTSECSAVNNSGLSPTPKKEFPVLENFCMLWTVDDTKGEQLGPYSLVPVSSLHERPLFPAIKRLFGGSLVHGLECSLLSIGSQKSGTSL